MSIAKSAMHYATGETVEGLDQYQPKKERKAGKKSEKTPATSASRPPAHTHEDGETLQIQEDKRNYRRHGEKNLSLIGRSLDDFGAGRSIVADNSGQVIGGNGTLREANKRGIPKRIIHTTGDELVVVVRDDIAPDDPRRQKLAIMDNSTTDTSEFEYMMLQEDFSIPELEDMGIEIPEDMLAIDDGEGTSGETEPDAVPEVEEEPVSVRGKVYQLGKHRLMCGDSTSAEDVALLMNGEKADIAFTSPLYGAGNVTNLRQHYDPKNKKLESFYKTHKDKPEEWRHLFKDSLQNMIVYAQSQFVNVQMLADNKINMISVVNEYAEFLVDILIWDKTSGPPQMQKNVLNNTFEFIFCFDSENNSRSIRFGDFHGTQSNVLRIKTGCNQYANIHKAVFPIDLPLEIFQINTKCKSVLDLFGGTGTTLIACEQTNRQCRMMELDEHYCDVIRKRWAEYVHGEGCDWQSLTPEVE